jgi:hypothetical protein
MELNDVIDFPIGGVSVLFGILALVVADSTLTAMCAPQVRTHPRALAACPAAVARGEATHWSSVRGRSRQPLARVFPRHSPLPRGRPRAAWALRAAPQPADRPTP